jgi:ornithine cyclodeaminase/alanine dehydrogenase-like protein (mu-crystallin family)
MRSNRVERMLVLGYDDVSRLLPMDECIEVMEEALAALARGEMYLPLRFVVRPPNAAGFIGLMPSYRGGDRPAFGLKAINVIPDNPRLRGLDAHQGGVLLSDGETGEPVAFLNASAITEIRTAAVSAVATRTLAREDSRELAILGAGVQARSHLEAMRAVRNFERIRIYSRTPAHARSLAEEGGAAAVGSAEEAVREADVVVTATSSADPVLERAWLKSGAHINAVGACLPHVRELDTRTVAEAAFFTDRRESAENEAGDYVLALKEGAIEPGHIRAELGDVLAGSAPGRSAVDEITIFESLGIAIEDLAAADHVAQRARAEGVGVNVAF